jgi:hypothetical protein
MGFMGWPWLAAQGCPQPLAQPFDRPILCRFSAGGFPQGAGQPATLLVGRDLHHPGSGFGMHQTGLQLHRASGGSDRFLEWNLRRA